MSNLGYVCLFQAIKVEYKNKPLQVLEEQFLPGSECTLEVAKTMFMRRFEDRSYSRQYGRPWPDAVRFIDERGAEVLRYTCWDYLKDQITKEADARADARMEAA